MKSVKSALICVSDNYKEVKMDPEQLLLTLRQNPECKSIFQKLDDASRERLTECVRSSALSENAEDHFLECCGAADLVDFGKRLGSKDKGRLTPADVEKFTNELVSALKHPKPEAEGKKKR